MQAFFVRTGIVKIRQVKRYLPPILLINLVSTVGLVYILLVVPPTSYLIEAAFLIVLGIAIAGWSTLGIYYLRKKWGRKDSPRFVLRAALRDGLILGVSGVAILTLNIFNELTWVTALAVLGLAIVGERLL